MDLCSDDVSWTECAQRVESAIENAASPQEAVDAANQWADRYEKLYAANAQQDMPPDDAQRFEDEISDRLKDELDKWLDPVQIAFSQALAKYLPTLSAVLEWTSGPIATAIYALVAPSPVSNDFVAAHDVNEKINALIRDKVTPNLNPIWQQSYDDMVKSSYETIRGKPLP